MEILVIILLVVALVLFILAGLGVGADRFNLVAFGLAAWVGAVLLQTV